MGPAEADALLEALESPAWEDRLQGVDRLRHLPVSCDTDFARRLALALGACLKDESLEVCCRCATVAPEALEWLQKAFASGPSNKPKELQRALQRLSENLGDDREAVRAATQQGLASFAASNGMRLASALRLAVEFGMRHPSSWRVRLHSILSVQQLVTSSSAATLEDADLAWLLDSLASCLKDPTPLVVNATQQSLSHLESVLSDRVRSVFEARLATPLTQQLLQELFLQPSGAVPDHSSVAVSAADTAAVASVAADAGSCSSATGLPQVQPHKFQPHQVLEQLEATVKWQERARILEEFHQSLLGAPPEEVGPHMSEVLLILNRLLTDTNFKITLTTLYIIGDLVDRFASCMMTVVGAVVPGLVEKVGDCKIVIRQTVSKIFHKIFLEVVRMGREEYADRLLHLLVGPLPQHPPHLRLELVGVVTMALLMFESGGVPYSREEALRAAYQAVQDPDEKVAVSAMEILAVLRPALGPAILDDRRCSDKAIIERIHQRLRIDVIATVNDEGLLECPQAVLDGSVYTAASSTNPPESPASPVRPANAAVAMGRLGRKMFCLEGQSGTPQSRQRPVTTNGAALRGGTPASPASAEFPEFPGRGGLVPSRVRFSPTDGSLLEGGRGSPAPEAVLEDPYGESVGERASGREPRGESPASIVSPSTASRQDRRQAPRGLRVNFKESLRDTLGPLDSPTQASSSTKREGSDSEWSRSLDLDGVSPAGSPSQAASEALPKSPNYIPNWSRQTSRQVRGAPENRRAQTAAAPPMGSGLLEDFETRESEMPQINESLEDSERLFRRSGHSLLLQQQKELQQFREQQKDSHVDIAGQLQLLRRPVAGRARSQGCCRSTVSRLGSRPDNRSSRGQLPRHVGKRYSSTPEDFEKLVIAEVDDDKSNGVVEASAEFQNLFNEGRSVNSPTGLQKRPSLESHYEQSPQLPGVARRRGEGSGSPSDNLGALLRNSGGESPTSLHGLEPSDFDKIHGGGSEALASRSNRRLRNSKLVGPDGAPVLLEFEELPPLDQPLPDRWIEDVFRRLGPTADWFSQFEALTDLRRIARFAPQMLHGPNALRPIVSNVIEILESLRSAVARAALVCLHDLLVAYRKHMDAELHIVVPACLRKAVDPNSILAEEADRTLQAMCRSVSEARGLAAILAFMADTRAKNPRARAKLTSCLSQLISRIGPRIFRNTDVDRLTQLLAKLLADAASAVRQLAKEATDALRAVAASQEEFDRFLCKVLGSQDLQKVRQALEEVTEAPRTSPDEDSIETRRRADDTPKRRPQAVRILR